MFIINILNNDTHIFFISNKNKFISSGAGGGSMSHNAAGITGEFTSWSPHVAYATSNETLHEGENLRITCKLTSFDKLKWMHNGTIITSDNEKMYVSF